MLDRRRPVALALVLAAAVYACARQEMQRSDTPDEVPLQEQEALRALGYTATVDDDAVGLPVGVLRSQPAAMAPGLTYYTSAGSCSSHVVDAEGRELARWSHAPCGAWENSVLAPDGTVYALHHYARSDPTAIGDHGARALLRLSARNTIVWETRFPAHHDMDVSDDGSLVTFNYRHRTVSAVDKKIPARDNALVYLSPSGAILRETSITDVLLRSNATLKPRKVRPRHKEWLLEIDHLHANSILRLREEPGAARHPIWGRGHLLLCLREQDSVVVVNEETSEIVWAWGQGVLSGPHDASITASGHLLVFDNGVKRKSSRALEVDPATGKVVWTYEPQGADRFFTRTRGSAQRLPNGNTLLTDSHHGLMREVTAAGEVVWELRNPQVDAEGRPFAVVRSRRFEPQANSTGAPRPAAWVD